MFWINLYDNIEDPYNVQYYMFCIELFNIKIPVSIIMT